MTKCSEHFAILFLAASLLTGCGSEFRQVLAPGTAAIGDVQGRVRGGQQPVVGAHVYLYAAGTSGNGGTGISASVANASSSLLDASVLINSPLGGGIDANLNYYVITDSSGSFSLTGDYTCVSGTQVYLYAVGGNPGAGANTAAAFLAGLGECPASGSIDATVPYVTMNEVTTVATAYALAGFASDATHISSDSGVSGNPTGALAATGIANAMANVSNIVDIGTGSALTTTPAGNGTVPQSEINSLANILAACVDSGGPSSGECSTLFGDATKDRIAVGTQATDTATAAVYIAQHPGVNVGELFGLQTAQAPFMPSLTTQPNDFTIAVQFSPSNLFEGGQAGVAIDEHGNAWITNDGYNGVTSVYEFSNTGVVLSGANGFNSGGFIDPWDIAIDQNGNVWVPNLNNGSYDGSVTELSSSGAVVPAVNRLMGGGLAEPDGIAIDGLGDAWTSDEASASVTKISPSGVFLSGSNGFSDGGFPLPDRIAIDGAGSAWVPSYRGNAIIKLSAVGAILSGGNGITGGGIDTPLGVAIDGSGSVWIINSVFDDSTDSFMDSVTKLSNSGAFLSGPSGYTGGGLSGSAGIAIDGAGSAWITGGFGSVTAISTSGAFLSGANGYSYGGDAPRNIAIDGSGDVWLLNEFDLTELIGVAVPVITPVSAGLPATPTADGSSKLGTRP